MGRCGMKKPASGKQSQLDDEQEHARLGQPGWHERRIRDVSPGGSLIACSSRLIVKLLLPGAGLLFIKTGTGRVRARLSAKPMNSVSEREPPAGKSWLSRRQQKEKGKCPPFYGIFLIVSHIPRRAGTIPRRAGPIPPQSGRPSWHSVHFGAAPE